MVSIEYSIEVWMPKSRRYFVCYRTPDRERASIMFHKPYNQIHTRRLVKVTTEIQLKAKGTK